MSISENSVSKTPGVVADSEMIVAGADITVGDVSGDFYRGSGSDRVYFPVIASVVKRGKDEYDGHEIVVVTWERPPTETTGSLFFNAEYELDEPVTVTRKV